MADWCNRLSKLVSIIKKDPWLIFSIMVSAFSAALFYIVRWVWNEALIREMFASTSVFTVNTLNEACMGYENRGSLCVSVRSITQEEIDRHIFDPIDINMAKLDDSLFFYVPYMYTGLWISFIVLTVYKIIVTIYVLYSERQSQKAVVVILVVLGLLNLISIFTMGFISFITYTAGYAFIYKEIYFVSLGRTVYGCLMCTVCSVISGIILSMRVVRKYKDSNGDHQHLVIPQDIEANYENSEESYNDPDTSANKIHYNIQINYNINLSTNQNLVIGNGNCGLDIKM